MIKSNNQSTCMEKMQRFQDYIKGLETERRKIQVFERELPLCLELVTQAIEGCKTQIFESMVEDFHGESECFEQTSSEDPVLEEFIPMKKSSATDEDEDHQEQQKSSDKPKINCMKNKSPPSKKSNWLRSAQLSIQTPDPLIKQGLSAKKISVMEEVKRSECGAFHPFKKDKSCGAAPASFTAERGGGGSKSEDKDEHQRKSRRCWSPELHRRFLHALQELGGAHVATPKQIRELMKVDGLTNDEVKSHLQKYRLHTKRPSHKINDNDSPQAPKFVVVGGLWMPPPEYTTMAASAPPPSVDIENTNNTKRVYIPTASLPPFISEASKSLLKMLQQSHSRSEKGAHRHCDSPSTSSSMHATTASAGAAF